MDKLFVLAWGNIRKSRGQTFSLFLLIIIASLLFNIGALTQYNFGVFFDEKIEELHAPHCALIFDKEEYRPSFEDYFRSEPLVTETATEDILRLPGCGFIFGGGKLTMSVILQNADISRPIAPFTLVGETEELTENSIYAPYLLKSGGGYNVGDDITLEYQHEEYVFQIAGFVEDMMFGSMNMGTIGFYLPESGYKRFMANTLAQPAVLMSVRLTDLRYGEGMVDSFLEEVLTDNEGAVNWGSSVETVKFARTISTNITSMVVVAFAIIITAVALIVIRFRIGDSIQDDIKNLGSLKAVGYTSRQIIGSISLQFLSVTLIASIVGIALSYLLVPAMSSVFSAQTGLIWSQGFAPATSLVCLCIILLSVGANALHAARSVLKLHPVTALRGDYEAGSYKKNHLPLDKTAGSLHVVLAGKTIMQNLRQSALIAFIIAAMTFASVFGLEFFYNMAVDSDTFIGTIAGEMCSVAVAPSRGINTQRLLREIEHMPGVRKAIFFDNTFVLINEITYSADIAEDFSLLEGQMLYEGSYPKQDDEVAIGGLSSAQLGKFIGDTITLARGDEQAEYRITGYIQSGNNIGKTLALTNGGIERILPDYIPSFIYIYMEEGEDAADLMHELEVRYGDSLANVLNFDEIITSQTQSYVTIVTLVAIIILIITALVVMLILYLVIKTTILRRKRDLGVQKALGFTTLQLVRQITMSFLPVVVAGVVLGMAAGWFGVNPMISALFQSVGIMRFDLIMAPVWLMFLCVGITVLAYVTALLVSLRIRDISAYALVTE